MKITVLYFAVLRERIGRSSESLELPERASAADAVALLAARYPVIGALQGRFQVAVGEAFVPDPASHILAGGEELALIPPVAGGGGPHVLLSDQPLSVDRCIAAVSGAEIGGISIFIGAVRRSNRGHTVERLEYEAYPAMAIRSMTELCAEIAAEVPGAVLAVEHRVGTLAIGDVAVVVAAGAPHRAEAFAACRALIDRLKERVPIWKKELADDGEVWIGLGP